MKKTLDLRMAGKKIFEVQTESDRFFHESLEKLLLWLDDEVETLCRNGLQVGWRDRVVAALIVLATVNESYFNSIGSKAIPEWDHDKRLIEKLKLLRKSFTPDCHFNKRPLASVNELRILRNKMVHAEPEIDRLTTKVVALEEDEDASDWSSINHTVEQDISLARYRRFRDDSEEFRKMLLSGSGLKHWDIKSKTTESTTFLRREE